MLVASQLWQVTRTQSRNAVIPMVVTGLKGEVAVGQFRGGEQLVGALCALALGILLTFLEPIYAGGLYGVTAGSGCVERSDWTVTASARMEPQHQWERRII